MKVLLVPILLVILVVSSGCVDTDSSDTMNDVNEMPVSDENEVMAPVPVTEIAVDIYTPITIPDRMRLGQSLVEFTIVDVISTSIDGTPQGWSGNNHNKFLLRVDNVLFNASNVAEPYIGYEFSILSHSDTDIHEGQRYLAFVNFDIVYRDRGGTPVGMTPYSLDSRVVAIVNEDSSITATISLGRYFMEFNGYTVEQIREEVIIGD